MGKSFSDSKKDDRTYLTHEKNSSLWDHFIFEKLLDQLSSFSSSEQSKYKFDRDISASLFSMAFSINKTADFSNRLSLNDALYDQKLDAVAKIYLKLSRQLDLKFVELVELLIEKSIEYASRNFEYKEMDKITRGDAGDHAYGFLVNYRYLGRSIEQFQKITLAELSKSNKIMICP